MEKLAYRVPEVLEATGLRRSQLYELMAAGEIASFSVGRVRLIPATAINDFIERRLSDGTSAGRFVRA